MPTIFRAVIVEGWQRHSDVMAQDGRGKVTDVLRRRLFQTLSNAGEPHHTLAPYLSVVGQLSGIRLAEAREEL